MPTLGITIGDAAGIGPEIILRALGDERLYERCRPVVFGSRSLLEREIDHLGLGLTAVDGGVPVAEKASPTCVVVHEVGDTADEAIRHGELSARAGELAVAAVRAAVAEALDDRISAIVTAPLNKEAMWAAGHHYDGHTGLLSELCGGREVVMLLVGDRLRVAHATTHVALRDVPDMITKARVEAVVRIAAETTEAMGLPVPRIAVAGLNPHAGEGGIFGDEEQRVVLPAILACREAGYDVVGPVPPDSVFGDAVAGRYDVVVAMYHDQGHVPVKLLEFDRAVNVTGGLPIIRTSVDHGTAFDIAGQGIARLENMEAAIDLAVKMGSRRAAGRA